MKKNKFTEAQIAFVWSKSKRACTSLNSGARLGLRRPRFISSARIITDPKKLDEVNTRVKRLEADLSVDMAKLQNVIKRKL